jgi:uracil-DNA glycosylase
MTLLSDQSTTLIQALDRTLRRMAASGVHGCNLSENAIKKVRSWGTAPKDERETLGIIRMDLGECVRCKLHEKRRNIVFGVGNPKARLVFVGEGPGADEDLKGEPFVGAAGQLLTRIIEAIHLTRNDVYITNIVKCRPPGNRNPEPDEIETCIPFLHRQLKSIGPEFICTLGNVAAHALLGEESPISKLRGKFYSYPDARLLPTYHPAALLRNAALKRPVWDDMKLLMEAMGIEIKPS